MKIFTWMQNKRKVKDGTTKPNPYSMSQHKTHQPLDEEYSDWPNGLLAIGTFGNINLKHSENITTQDDLENTTTEDFEEVDQQLRLILNKHTSLGFQGESEKHNLSVDKLLDAFFREAEEKTGDESTSSSSERYQKRTKSIVHTEGKDIRSHKKKSGINKRSLSFLIKKVILCRGGFVSGPNVTDSLLNPKLDNSRMEKILRAMLHKKIYPQRRSPKNTRGKYLDMPESESDSESESESSDKEENEEHSHRSKWVKTDSEYIVLEI